MDTRESKTREEQEELVKGQREPEHGVDSHPEEQPEAKRSPNGMHRLIPIAIAVAVVLILAFWLFGGTR